MVLEGPPNIYGNTGPENWKGPAVIFDLWGYGAVFYELYTGPAVIFDLWGYGAVLFSKSWGAGSDVTYLKYACIFTPS